MELRWMMYGIEQWYDEKEDYVKGGNGVTGHYKSLINPYFNYIGLGAFQPAAGGWCAVAAEFSFGSGLDETKSSQMGTVIQAIEIKKSAISAPKIKGVSSMSIGSNKQFELIVNITYPGIMGGNNVSEGVSLGNVSWSSSNPQVAEIDPFGNVKAQSGGLTTITATSSDGLTASCNVNVISSTKGENISAGNVIYKITKAYSTVEYVKMNNKATTVVIPATVTIGGIKYKVTSIANNAFKNNKTLKKVTIGSNVTWIGKNAFKGINSKATIKVPSSKLKAYKTLLTKRGAGKKVKIKK